MARARSIKPGFFRNADLVELPMEARLLFIGLWTLSDRSGRMEDRPKQIKMEIFPADNVDCDALLDQLAGTGMLERYAVGGKRYLQVVNFAKHQNPHRDEKDSTLPDSNGNCAKPIDNPPKHSASTVQAQCKDVGNPVVIGLTPDSGLLTPDSGLLTPDSTTHTSPRPPPTEVERSPPTATKAGAVCVVLKSEGIATANPGHPELLALLEKGAEVGLFAGAAKLAATKGNHDFAYVLGIVKRQMAAAASIAATPMAVPQAIASITVPGRQGVDPELEKAIADSLKNTKGPPPAVRAKIAEITKGRPAA